MPGFGQQPGGMAPQYPAAGQAPQQNFGMPQVQPGTMMQPGPVPPQMAGGMMPGMVAQPGFAPQQPGFGAMQPMPPQNQVVSAPCYAAPQATGYQAAQTFAAQQPAMRPPAGPPPQQGARPPAPASDPKRSRLWAGAGGGNSPGAAASGKRTRGEAPNTALEQALGPVNDQLSRANSELTNLIGGHKAAFAEALRQELHACGAAGLTDALNRARTRMQSRKPHRALSKVQTTLNDMRVSKLREWPSIEEEKRTERRVLIRMAERVGNELDDDLALLDRLAELSTPRPYDIKELRRLAAAEVDAERAKESAEAEAKEASARAVSATGRLSAARAARVKQPPRPSS